MAMANSVQMNTRFVVGLLAIIGVSVYLVYSVWFKGGRSESVRSDSDSDTKLDKSNKLKVFKTWKHREFIDIPQSVKDSMKSGITVDPRHLEFTPAGESKVRLVTRLAGKIFLSPVSYRNFFSG